MKPTVFANVNNNMTIAREEIFGPVLVMIPYKDEAEAIRIANDTVYGLSGYVYSGNIENARRVAAKLRESGWSFNAWCMSAFYRSNQCCHMAQRLKRDSAKTCKACSIPACARPGGEIMPRLSLQASVNEPCTERPYPAASFFFSAR